MDCLIMELKSFGNWRRVLTYGYLRIQTLAVVSMLAAIPTALNLVKYAMDADWTY